MKRALPLSLLTIAALTVGAGIAVRLSAALPVPPGHADRGPELRCDDVGACRGGEKRLLIGREHAATVAELRKKGCRIRHALRREFSVLCPESVSVTVGREERVFQVTDAFALGQFGASSLHAEGVTGGGIRVAVLDTGADLDHPELAPRVAAHADFTGDGEDDVRGHGTHVSGIALGMGIHQVEQWGKMNSPLGVAPAADLLVAKVCNNVGWCLEGDIHAGIEWAVAQRARVMNLSLGQGGYLDHCDDDSIAQAVNWAVRRGVVVVASAGNGGEIAEGVGSPACSSQVIAVGAIDGADNRTSWSGYGKALDVMAPGLAILSSVSCEAAGTCPLPAYGWWSGTSMAAPQVAGLAALLLQIDPTLTPAAVRAAITSTATDMETPGFDIRTGYGRIDAVAAAAAVRQPGSSSSSSSSSSSEGSSASSSGSSSTSSSASSQSGETPRQDVPCTAAAWVCDHFQGCGPDGREHRHCRLLDERCTGAERVRPEQERSCERPAEQPQDQGQQRGEDRGQGQEQRGEQGPPPDRGQGRGGQR